jgi:hypothetical protein
MAIRNRQCVHEARGHARSPCGTSASGVALQLWQVVLALTCCALLMACKGTDAEDLEVAVTVDGDTVTVSWDGSPVHTVDFFLMVPQGGTGVWGVSVYEASNPQPRREPEIVPPIRYGEDVDNAFVLYGPEPLLRGRTYEVQLFVLGWTEMCDAEGATDDDSACFIAHGRASFTF